MGSGNKRFTRMGSLLTVAIGVIGNAAATENFDLRYAPGFGGRICRHHSIQGGIFRSLVTATRAR